MNEDFRELCETKMKALRELHDKDIRSVKEYMKRVDEFSKMIDVKLDTALNHLSSRLPLWANVLLMVLIATIGYMAKSAIGD